MILDTITENETLLTRRMTLEPEECTCWHTGSCNRFAVVVRGSALTIEFRVTEEIIEYDVYPGVAGWDSPETEVHRVVNGSADTYEVVVTFYKPSPEVILQPGGQSSDV